VCYTEDSNRAEDDEMMNGATGTALYDSLWGEPAPLPERARRPPARLYLTGQELLAEREALERKGPPRGKSGAKLGNPLRYTKGPGPEGATCGRCAHLSRVHHNAGSYLKCALYGDTRGPGSDYRLKWDACALYEERPGNLPALIPVRKATTIHCPTCGKEHKIRSWYPMTAGYAACEEPTPEEITQDLADHLAGKPQRPVMMKAHGFRFVLNHDGSVRDLKPTW
jgi:hypothetical protein